MFQSNTIFHHRISTEQPAKPQNAAYVALCISHMYDMYLVEISRTLIA